MTTATAPATRLDNLREVMRRGQQAAADLAESESEAKQAADALAAAQQEAIRAIHRHNGRAAELQTAIDAAAYARIDLLRALPAETRQQIAAAQSRLDKLAGEIHAAEQHAHEKRAAVENARDAAAKGTYAGHLRRATIALADLREKLPAAIAVVDRLVTEATESVDGTAATPAAA